MSIATDLASIHILASVYQKPSVSELLSETVTSLCNRVEYIDWSGIFIKEGEVNTLKAYASSSHNKEANMQSQLTFPIKNKEKEELGALVVKSEQWIVFDVTDVATLEQLALELGESLS